VVILPSHINRERKWSPSKGLAAPRRICDIGTFAARCLRRSPAFRIGRPPVLISLVCIAA
jgi:hypothetical protein